MSLYQRNQDHLWLLSIHTYLVTDNSAAIVTHE